MKRQILQFPEPDADALQHSQLLTDAIVEEINQQGGQITFERYMALALSKPGLGYYVSGNQKFGASGDFVTAPEISSLFSRCVAQQCMEIISNLPTTSAASILEFGAGTGVMAADILLEMEQLDALPRHYYILEVSAELKQRQQQTLTNKVPHLLGLVEWLDELPADGFNGVILANEVLDAMPVHRFYKDAERTGEYFVGWVNNEFVWKKGQFSFDVLREKVVELEQLIPEGYSSEINLAASAWVSSIAKMLQSGVALIIDYGFPRHEYYHPDRVQGTLMCHYRHRAHEDPFLYPGLQDITAHVDFTAVAEDAYKAGMEIKGYTNQAFFLLGNGVEKYLENKDSSSTEFMKLSQQLKTLTMPGEMGELFKVIALGKEYNEPLKGFSFKDNRSKL